MKVAANLLHKYFGKAVAKPKAKLNTLGGDKADGQAKLDRSSAFTYGKSRSKKGKAKKMVKK